MRRGAGGFPEESECFSGPTQWPEPLEEKRTEAGEALTHPGADGAHLHTMSLSLYRSFLLLRMRLFTDTAASGYHNKSLTDHSVPMVCYQLTGNYHWHFDWLTGWLIKENGLHCFLSQTVTQLEDTVRNIIMSIFINIIMYPGSLERLEYEFNFFFLLIHDFHTVFPWESKVDLCD